LTQLDIVGNKKLISGDFFMLSNLTRINW